MNEFRVLFDPAMTGKPFISGTYTSYSEANSVLDELANYTLMLEEAALMSDYSNFGVVQQKIGVHWVDSDE